MKKIIVLIGRIASGKDYAGNFLAQKFGAKHVGISSSLRIIAGERGVEETRENLIMIGREVTKQFGDGYLAEVLVNNVDSDFLIISGARQVGQIEYLRDNTHCIVIGIESNQLTRYNRMLNRGKIGEDLIFQKFQEIEKMEEGGIQDVGKCLSLCDQIIENNGSLVEFEKELFNIIK